MDKYYFIAEFLPILSGTVLMAGMICPFRKNVMKYILFTVLSYAFYISLDLLRIGVITHIIMQIFLSVLIFLIFKKSFRSVILIECLFYMFEWPLEMICAAIYKILINPGTKDLFNSYLEMAQFYTGFCILIFLIYLFVPIRKFVEYVEKVSQRYTILALNLVIFLLILKVIMVRYQFPFYPDILLLSISIIIIVILNIKIFKDAYDDEWQKKMLEQHKTFETTILAIVDELRTKQHDFNNHLTAIQYLSGLNSFKSDSSIDSYISGFTSELKQFEPFMKVENKVVGAILHTKYIEAEKKGIRLEVVIPAYDVHLPIMDFEYSAIIFNLLDNAIEAAEKYTSEDKKIIFRADYDMDHPYIEVWNTGEPVEYGTIPMLFKKGYSTKGDSEERGYGLYNIKKIADKYKAEFEVINKAPFVIFRMMFYKNND